MMEKPNEYIESTKEHFESLFGNAKEYFDNKKQLWILKLVDKAASVISSVIDKMILVVFGLLFFVFINIALALLIGYWLGHSFWGFFVMAALYGIVGFIIHKSRDKLIKTPIINGFIQKFVK